VSGVAAQVDPAFPHDMHVVRQRTKSSAAERVPATLGREAPQTQIASNARRDVPPSTLPISSSPCAVHHVVEDDRQS